MSLPNKARATLYQQHLLARNQLITRHFADWRTLRSRRKEEIGSVGLLQVSQATWYRFKEEISALGTQQQAELGELTQQQNEALMARPAAGKIS